MLIYLNLKSWGEKLSPLASPRLQVRELDDFNKHAEAAGFHAVYGADDWIQIVLPNVPPQQIFQFLEHCGAAAVGVEPADIAVLLGRSPFSLALKNSIEANGAAFLGLEMVEPDELMDALEAAMAKCNSIDARPFGLDMEEAADTREDLMTEELISAGLLPESARPQKEELQPHVEYDRQGHIVRNNRDISEFFPESDPFRDSWS